LLVLLGEDLVSDLLGASDFSDFSDVDESLALSVDFTSPVAPEEDESSVLSVDFTSPVAPEEDESSVLSVDFTSPVAPESLVLSVDFASPELLGEDNVPLGASVLPVPPVVSPGLVSVVEFVPPAQAPRINVSPNTSEKAVNLRLTMISPKIFKIFCMESG
jgi:hypothetical protein